LRQDSLLVTHPALIHVTDHRGAIGVTIRTDNTVGRAARPVDRLPGMRRIKRSTQTRLAQALVDQVTMALSFRG
jgi:hypothetical protein